MRPACPLSVRGAHAAPSNCLPADNYFDWPGWDDPADSLNQRWGTAVRYHAGYKWTWLNQGDARLTLETVEDVQFADVLYAQAHQRDEGAHA